MTFTQLSVLVVVLMRPTEVFMRPAEVTAYCSCKKCCGSQAAGLTANGYKLKPKDLVIAAPKNIPFGTKIYVPGYGLAVVKDRGGAIKGDKLDVWFASHQEALKWGRQKLIVTQFGEKK